jgi:hypothetical protein
MQFLSSLLAFHLGAVRFEDDLSFLGQGCSGELTQDESGSFFFLPVGKR